MARSRSGSPCRRGSRRRAGGARRLPHLPAHRDPRLRALRSQPGPAARIQRASLARARRLLRRRRVRGGPVRTARDVERVRPARSRGACRGRRRDRHRRLRRPLTRRLLPDADAGVRTAALGPRAELDVPHRRLERDLRDPRPDARQGARSWLASGDHFYWYALGAFLVGYAALAVVVRLAVRTDARRDSRQRGTDELARVQRRPLQAGRVHLRRRDRGIRGRTGVPADEVLLPGRDVVQRLRRRRRRHRDRRPADARRSGARHGLLLHRARPALGRALVALAARARRRLRAGRLPAPGRARRPAAGGSGARFAT